VTAVSRSGIDLASSSSMSIDCLKAAFYM